jgi:hypothetical protein
MAKKEVYPGARCRIIGSANGPNGKSVGRIVTARYIQTGAPHTLWGEVWVVEDVDGVPFDRTPNDGILPDMTQCHCPEDWLLVLDDDPESPKAQERERELTH